MLVPMYMIVMSSVIAMSYDAGPYVYDSEE